MAMLTSFVPGVALRKVVDSCQGAITEEFLTDYYTANLAASFEMVFPWGKYQGQTIAEIVHNDPGYLIWVCNQEIPKLGHEDVLTFGKCKGKTVSEVRETSKGREYISYLKEMNENKNELLMKIKEVLEVAPLFSAILEKIKVAQYPTV